MQTILISLQCQKFIQKGSQFSWPSVIDLNKSLTLAALQGLIHADLCSDVSFFIWQLLTFKGSIIFLRIILNKNSLKHSTPGSELWKFSHECDTLSLKGLFIFLKKKKSPITPKAVVDYLALRRSPGALPHTAPSSWSASDPWRRGPLHNLPPPTGKSEWLKWHPCPTRRGSAQSTWSILPKRQNRKGSQSYNNPELTFSFSWLFFSFQYSFVPSYSLFKCFSNTFNGSKQERMQLENRPEQIATHSYVSLKWLPLQVKAEDYFSRLQVTW